MDSQVQEKVALLSEKEAAAMLGVSRLTLLRLRNSARISFYRIGRRVLFSADQIVDYLETVRQPVIERNNRAA
jgi:excisionase family DNA binding protein